MKGLKRLAAAALLVSFGCNAGAYGDELNKCVLARTDEAGKTAIMHWLFIASAKHPENKNSYMKNDVYETLAERSAAAVFADTFGRACKIEADLAVNVEGKVAMQNAVLELLYSSMVHTFNNSDVVGYMKESDPLFTSELDRVRERSERFRH